VLHPTIVYSCLEWVQWRSVPAVFLCTEHFSMMPLTLLPISGGLFQGCVYRSWDDTINCMEFCFTAADDRWDFAGSTIVTNNYIRLTQDEQSRQGAIWNKIVSFRGLLLASVKYKSLRWNVSYLDVTLNPWCQCNFIRKYW